MLDVVVIGGVAAGMSAAAKLKRTLGDGVAVTVFEKGSTVSYAACGIPYFVSGRVADAARLIERTPEEFAKAGIEVNLRHEVTGVDLAAKTVRVRRQDDGAEFARGYDKLVVASGARVRRMPPFDGRWDNLHVVRDLDDGVGLRRRLEDDAVRNVLVVGAGFVGLEIVDACVKRGKRVLLVEYADRVLPAMDPEFSDSLAAELARNGVEARTGSKVVRLQGEGGRIEAAALAGEAGEEMVQVDAVVNCAGIVPNTEFIDVAKAANGAIVVDGAMRTSDPDVHAGGDCSVMTSFVTGELQYAPLGTNANKQGRIIAEVLAGKTPPKLKLIGSSAIRLFGVDAAKVGVSEVDARRLGLDCKANRIVGNSYASYYGDDKVTVKLVYDAATRRILGAQTLGRGAVAERANYFVAAISAGMTVDEFGFLDFCYSPPFNGVWDATLIAANTAK